MKQTAYVLSLLLLLVGAVSMTSPDWGFFGHRRINRMAVFTLDQEMMPFFRANLEYLTDHAVDPDKRRYATKHEAVRHYVDIDHWGTYPFPDVPRDWAEALLWQAEVQVISGTDTTSWRVKEIRRVNTDSRGGGSGFLEQPNKRIAAANETAPVKSKSWNPGVDSVFLEVAGQPSTRCSLSLADYRSFWYLRMLPQYYEEEWSLTCGSLDSLGWKNVGSCDEVKVVDHFSEYGILPYHLLQMKRNLTRAFEAGSAEKILRYAAEFGHYIGDAHVPLHTTENYNGQLTNQVGIHGFWESRIPELMADAEYDYFVGKAEYIDDPKEYFWQVVLKSHSLVDSVLQSEKRLSQTFPADQQYCYEDRLDRTIRTYCPEYARAWAEMMRGMVEERFRASILSIGSVWYTCWVDAGQPDLDRLLVGPLKQPSIDSLDQIFRSGTIKGRAHDG
ncbi:MAG: zinc dependent phospholipase C family protein [Bacteroidota bacterium]